MEIPISVTPQIPLCLRAPALTAIDKKIKHTVDLYYGLRHKGILPDRRFKCKNSSVRNKSPGVICC